MYYKTVVTFPLPRISEGLPKDTTICFVLWAEMRGKMDAIVRVLLCFASYIVVFAKKGGKMKHLRKNIVGRGMALCPQRKHMRAEVMFES